MKKNQEPEPVIVQEEPFYLGSEDDCALNARRKLPNWRNLIPEEFLRIRDEWLNVQGVTDYETLSPELKAELREKAGDANMTILNAGFRHLAHLRGLCEVNYEVTHLSDGVCCKAILKFAPVFIDGNGLPSILVSGLANATSKNTTYPYCDFQESIAENRSFARAVKTALNINILGEDELSTKPVAQKPLFIDDEGTLSAQESLRKLVESKDVTFGQFKQKLVNKEWPGSENWNDYKDIPSDQCLLMVGKMVEKKNKS